MKYIRTKDDIQAFNDGCDLQYVYTAIGGIKIADTIEELCDEFVTAYLDGFHQIALFPSKVDNMLGHSVYGAIWTEKGLKYVAKINNKGELELLI